MRILVLNRSLGEPPGPIGLREHQNTPRPITQGYSHFWEIRRPGPQVDPIGRGTLFALFRWTSTNPGHIPMNATPTSPTAAEPLRPLWTHEPSSRPGRIRQSIRIASVTDQVIETLQSKFDGFGHYPSPIAWTALTELVDVFHDIVTGRAAPRIYLCQLPPGTGKSQCLGEYVKATRNRGVGVLIAAQRLEEIEDKIQDMDLAEEDYAVHVSDDRIAARGLGKDRINEARVLFTTHKAIMQRLNRGQTWKTMRDFEYQGAPRTLRVWDEALVAGLALSVDRAHIMDAATSCARAGLGDLFTALDRLQIRLADVSTGDTLLVPDLPRSLEALDLHFEENPKKAPTQRVKETLQALYAMSGAEATVRLDGGTNYTAALTYREVLPEDTAPLVVLDASIAHREYYKVWQETRPDANIKRLRDAPKKYDNLTFHVADVAGSKSAWSDPEKAEQYLGLIGDVMTQRDDLTFGVIHHKSDPATNSLPDVPGVLRELTEAPFRAITWGRHDASNELRDCDGLILCGTLFQPKGSLEALARLAYLRPPGEEITPEELQRITDGEMRDMIYQAVGRSAIRKADKFQGHSTECWILAHKRSGVREALTTLFPGCTVKTWIVPGSLTGRAHRIFQYVMAAETAGIERIYQAKMAHDLEMSKSNVSDLLRTDSLVSALNERGWYRGPEDKLRKTYLERRPTPQEIKAQIEALEADW